MPRSRSARTSSTRRRAPPIGPRRWRRHCARSWRSRRSSGSSTSDGGVTMAEPDFTIGIEEEYLLVDRQSRDLVDDPPPAMLAECESLLAGQVSPEFLRSQIEVATRICASTAEARADLARLRSTVAAVAARHGMAPIAASTHPFAQWDTQKPTARERYALLHRDLQGVARRLVICGLHVHVGLPEDELRIDLMNQIRYFLPHLLALSTSSPFWQ